MEKKKKKRPKYKKRKTLVVNMGRCLKKPHEKLYSRAYMKFTYPNIKTEQKKYYIKITSSPRRVRFDHVSDTANGTCT
jgi:hypothetical protein